ncbi:hypothetical protein GGU11DRAFT_802782 [Lentinula aff. detonsa]|nr:hypothetical protein GGU11DRAFT_802782 [Lentinula aff. detonsa]
MDSARIPPNLSYLTIYNPTLRPSTPTPDDEDAEEQAQILFYTSKERAVSRDRMLRQVGLAKALVNFSGMFNADTGCENVHSQTRRMIMVFPEPDFCIHAGVELAKVPRPMAPTSKSRGKEPTVKSILKGKEKELSITTYDYSDASVNDQALQDDILKAYERFKLSHGSFTTILSTLGQQALELQLERFFTVWAWSWNLEDGLGFGQHLETPLHPMYRRILPLLDTFSDNIPNTIIPIAVTSTHAIPSTRFTEAHLPAILSKYLLSLVPGPTEGSSLSPSTSSMHDSTRQPKPPPDPDSHQVNNEEPDLSSDNFRSTFMGMGMPHMDVGKWGWLSFGKNGKKSTKEQDEAKPAMTGKSDIPQEETLQTPISVDQSSLDDAISSESVMPIGLSASNVKPELEKDYFTTAELDDISIVSGIKIESDTASTSSRPLSKSPSPFLPREFMSMAVHLAENTHSFHTRKRKIYYLTKHPFLLALIGLDENGDNLDLALPELEPLSRKVDDLLDTIGIVLDDEASKSSAETIPSLSKILQPKDRHVFSLGRAPFAVQDDLEMFTSNSIHLFNAQALLQSQHNIQEVFSRGQNPQHWHIARSVSQTSARNEDQVGMLGEMYMQIFRKEMSLTDVDNVLTGAIRRMEEDVL